MINNKCSYAVRAGELVWRLYDWMLWDLQYGDCGKGKVTHPLLKSGEYTLHSIQRR